MPSPKKSTSQLLSDLKRTNSFDRYFSRNQADVQEVPLAEHLRSLCKEKAISPGELMRSVDIDRVFGYQILTGYRSPSREYILKLAVGLGLSIEECQRLLTISHNSQLYPRIPRDAAILFCLHNGYNYLRVQDYLFELDMTLLGEKNEK